MGAHPLTHNSEPQGEGGHAACCCKHCTPSARAWHPAQGVQAEWLLATPASHLKVWQRVVCARMRAAPAAYRDAVEVVPAIVG